MRHLTAADSVILGVDWPVLWRALLFAAGRLGTEEAFRLLGARRAVSLSSQLVLILNASTIRRECAALQPLWVMLAERLPALERWKSTPLELLRAALISHIARVTGH